MNVRGYNKQMDQEHSLQIYSSSSILMIDLPLIADLPFAADLPFIADLPFAADLPFIADLPLLLILRGEPRFVCAD